MVHMLAASAVNRFSTKHAILRRKSKDWLALNQDNVNQHVYQQTVVSVSQHCTKPRVLVKYKAWIFLQYQKYIKACLIILLMIDCFIYLLCLMPLSAIFQLYHGDQFQWWKKLEYTERTIDHGQATGKLYHLRL